LRDTAMVRFTPVGQAIIEQCDQEAAIEVDSGHGR
jgi:hypothetical protein